MKYKTTYSEKADLPAVLYSNMNLKLSVPSNPDWQDCCQQ